MENESTSIVVKFLKIQSLTMDYVVIQFFIANCKFSVKSNFSAFAFSRDLDTL